MLRVRCSRHLGGTILFLIRRNRPTLGLARVSLAPEGGPNNEFNEFSVPTVPPLRNSFSNIQFGGRAVSNREPNGPAANNVGGLGMHDLWWFRTGAGVVYRRATGTPLAG